jgi:hypothetical protein
MSGLGVRSRLAGIAVVSAFPALSVSAPPVGAATGQPVMRVGTAAGPYKIVGLNPGTIAHMDLPAGNWAVFVTGEIDNTDVNTLHRHVVNCSLQLGSALQSTKVAPKWASSDSPNATFMLNVAAHLGVQRTVVLSCNVPAAATGVEKIRGVRMVAMQSQALTIQSQHTTYGNQAALSHIYHVSVPGPVKLDPTDAGNWRDIAHLYLPAGSWTMAASASITGHHNSIAQVHCRIITATSDYDETQTAVGGNGKFLQYANVSSQVDHTSAGSWAAAFQCYEDQPLNATVTGLRITAYRAQLMLHQDLSVNDTFPTEPSSVKPLVFGGWENGPVPFPAGAVPHAAAAQVLPAGHWVVMAKGELDHTGGLAIETVTCYLGSSPSASDTVKLVLDLHNYTAEIQPFTLEWHGTLSGFTYLAVNCKGPDGFVTAKWVKMTAYRAGTLKTVGLR